MRLRTWGAAAAAGGCALALGACQTLKPKPLPHLDVPGPPVAAAKPPPAPPPPAPPKVVEVPVKQACVPKTFPKAPKYPDSDQALRDAGGAADRYQLMAAGRVLRERRLAELEKLVEGCR
ncbi:hypothetical protein [Phenylobacterium sp.]|jgi:hypothetical protein|uniref:hypothetical protein n=1 Tax=Phenylobacterium sp. TaxID=1871053 RepID=UPI002F3FDD0B